MILCKWYKAGINPYPGKERAVQHSLCGFLFLPKFDVISLEQKETCLQ